MVAGMLAIIAGIFGMHILSGSHDMPMAAGGSQAGTLHGAHVMSGPVDGQKVGEESSSPCREPLPAWTRPRVRSWRPWTRSASLPLQHVLRRTGARFGDLGVPDGNSPGPDGGAVVSFFESFTGRPGNQPDIGGTVLRPSPRQPLHECIVVAPCGALRRCPF